MATNAAPVYGKQYIRLAETFEAAQNTQGGAVGTVEIGEYCCVAYATYAGPMVCAPPNAFTTAPADVLGVNQAYIPTALAEPYTARQASVATSGLLLVVQDPAAPFQAGDLNAQLAINGKGQAAKNGTEVTIDGSTPLIREVVAIGGRSFVVVSI
jgi:hypothetical protein